MANFKSQKIDRNFHSQFCCLISLAFPTLLLSNPQNLTNSYIRSKNLEFSPANIDSMYNLTQRKSIRSLALKIITTIESEIVSTNANSINPNFYRNKLIKNYLLKYQLNYFRYFIGLYPELDKATTVKELNMEAIETLYFISGI